jgi:hypothetical protein
VARTPARPSHLRPDQDAGPPSHPRGRAALLMAALLVVLIALAVSSTVGLL